jgi:hypothetical protein
MTNVKALLTNGIQRLKDSANDPDPLSTIEYVIPLIRKQLNGDSLVGNNEK